MTTAAAYRGVVAVDSQHTVADTKFECNKIVDAGPYKLIPCGNTGEISVLIRELAAGVAKPKCGGLHFFLFDPRTGILSINWGSFDKEPVDPEVPIAIGSGMQAAMGALLSGKGAAEAVETACRVDLYSSTPVRVFDYANYKDNS